MTLKEPGMGEYRRVKLRKTCQAIFAEVRGLYYHVGEGEGGRKHEGEGGGSPTAWERATGGLAVAIIRLKGVRKVYGPCNGQGILLRERRGSKTSFGSRRTGRAENIDNLREDGETAAHWERISGQGHEGTREKGGGRVEGMGWLRGEGK